MRRSAPLYCILRSASPCNNTWAWYIAVSLPETPTDTLLGDAVQIHPVPCSRSDQCGFVSIHFSMKVARLQSVPPSPQFPLPACGTPPPRCISPESTHLHKRRIHPPLAFFASAERTEIYRSPTHPRKKQGCAPAPTFPLPLTRK